jgi:putative spermidine/putrescine transport system substrate-binding protein
MEELDIDIEFSPGGSAEVLHRAASRPESFDLYEQWSDSMQILWRANAIQAVDIGRLDYWPEVNALTKTGRLTPDAPLGAGDAPYKLLYVQSDGTLGAKPTAQISFLPYVHNTDAFGYNTAVIPRRKAYESESWGMLLDPQWAGRVALVNSPTIGLFDAALAADAQGLMRFKDIGDLSRDEVDELFAILSEYKQNGHFAGLWNSVPESVEFMADGRTVVSSMFSQAVTMLNAMGSPVVYAAPKEGYRAWHGVMCLSSKTEGEVKDAAYRYMNWWLSGWPGAFVARQGYYISNAERSREYLSADEWGYWYDGAPAANPLHGTDGRVVVKTGEQRNGGSYTDRFSHVAVWNTVMNTYEYSLPLWHELILD